jgi:hypothetical protein
MVLDSSKNGKWGRVRKKRVRGQGGQHYPGLDLPFLQDKV